MRISVGNKNIYRKFTGNLQEVKLVKSLGKIFTENLQEIYEK